MRHVNTHTHTHTTHTHTHNTTQHTPNNNLQHTHHQLTFNHPRDWEGFCKEECLKGACTCGWNDQFCGQFSPDELAQGQLYIDGGVRTMCWIMPTQSSMQVRGHSLH